MGDGTDTKQSASALAGVAAWNVAAVRAVAVDGSSSRDTNASVRDAVDDTSESNTVTTKPARIRPPTYRGSASRFPLTVPAASRW